MSKITDFFKSLIARDGIVRIISLVLAIGLWLYIVNIADPSTTREYTDIPVQFNYEGSTADTNELMPLLASTVFTVNVKVSGPRTSFINFSKYKITAKLNMNSVGAEGTYNIPIYVSTADEALTCEIVGDNYVSIEFKKRAKAVINLQYEKIGNYVSGYMETNVNIEPSTVTVTGPRDIVERISTASAKVSVIGYKENFTKLVDISLFDANGAAVDRTFLTLDVTQAYIDVDLEYQKEVPFRLSLVNRYGGDESSYAVVNFSTPTIVLRGPEDILSGIESIDVGPVYLDTIKTSHMTFTLPVTLPGQITSVDEITQVTADVSLGTPKTKTFTLDKNILQKTEFLNLDPAYTAAVTTRSLKVALRAQSDVIDDISADDFILYVDLNAKDPETGKYPLSITLPEYIPGGFMAQYYVDVDLEPINH